MLAWFRRKDPKPILAPREEWALGSIGDVNEWFSLSRSQYLTVPRSIMEAMPLEWQQRIVRCLRELDETFDWRPKNARYYCFLRKGNGHFGEDPLHEYRHPSLSYIESLRNQTVEDAEPPGQVYRCDKFKKSDVRPFEPPLPY
jgi:hypothetical protein